MDLAGGFAIRSSVLDADFFIQGNDGGSIINALQIDMSAGGNATFAGAITVQSGNKLILNRPNNAIDCELSTDSSGTLILNSRNSEGFKFQNNGTSALTIDSSQRATFAANSFWGDSVKLVLGAGSDLQIYHNGSNSFIQDTGTGGLVISTSLLEVYNAAVDEFMIVGTENGAVDLYHNGSKKFETTANGVKITSGHLSLNSNDEGRIVGDADSIDFNLWDNSSAYQTRMTILDTGLIGMGSSSPSSYNSRGQDLVIKKTGKDTGISIVAEASGGTDYSSSILFADGTGGTAGYRGVIEYDHATDHMAISTAGTERMRIDSSGNVGIGTTSPSATLNIKSLNSTNSDSLSDVITKSEFKLQYRADDLSSMYFGGLGSERGYLQSINNAENNGASFSLNPYGGNVGIGNTSPARPLSVNSSQISARL